MDEVVKRFIRRENLALFRKRLAEPHNDMQHHVLLKLLAEEEAKGLPPGNDRLQREGS